MKIRIKEEIPYQWTAKSSPESSYIVQCLINKTQKTEKERENSYQKMKRSLKERHTPTHRGN